MIIAASARRLVATASFLAAAATAWGAPPPGTPTQPLTLQDCVRLALDGNPAVRSADAGVDVARAGVTGALAPIVPHLGSLSLSYARAYVAATDSSRRIFQGIEFTQPYRPGYTGPPDIALSLGASTELFSYYRWRDLARARLDRTASGYEATDARASVAFNTVSDFYGLVGAEKRLAVAVEASGNEREREARARAFFQVGTVARGDVSKATRDLAQAELDSITAVNDVAVARAHLAATMGLDPESPIAIVSDLGDEATSAAPGAPADAGRPTQFAAAASDNDATAGPPRSLIGARPDIRALETRADAAHARQSTITASQWPSLSLSMTNQWRANRFPGPDARLDRNYTWYLSLDLTVPILNWQANHASIGEAAATARQAEYRLDEAKQSAVQDLVTARLRYAEAGERIAVARTGLAAAEDDYAFSRERYAVGAGTQLELRDAQLGLSRARLALIDALVAQQIAQAALARAEGREIVPGTGTGAVR